MDLKSYVESINKYIVNYKNLTESNAKEIIEFIKLQNNTIKAKMCYEHLSCINKIIKIKEEYKNKPDNVEFENIKSVNDIVVRFKFVLSSYKYQADFNNPIIRQANGIILAIEETDLGLTCNVLAVPPNEFNPKFDQTELTKNISKGYYKLYEIQDGTTITMFYDSNCVSVNTNTKLQKVNDVDSIVTKKTYKLGKWIYSTKNSFDVSEIVWRGFNYGKVIDNTLSKYNFDFNKLDTLKSYTIGFKHPAFHPFNQPAEWQTKDFDLSDLEKSEKTEKTKTEKTKTEELEESKTEKLEESKTEESKTENESEIKWIKNAWFIHSYDHKNNVKNTEENIGLPLQKVMDSSNLPNIFNKLSSSLKDYINNNKIKQYMEKQNNYNFNDAFLGLILRSEDENKTNNLSDVLLESALWQEIRKLIYQLPYIQNKALRENQEQNFKNMTYVILDSYTDIKKKQLFISVFPQYTTYFKHFDLIINTAVDKIYFEMLSTSKYKVNDQSKANYKNNLNIQDETIATEIYKYFNDIVKNNYQITFKKSNYRNSKKQEQGVYNNYIDKKNIKNIIINNKNTEKLYKIIYNL